MRYHHCDLVQLRLLLFASGCETPETSQLPVLPRCMGVKFVSNWPFMGRRWWCPERLKPRLKADRRSGD